MTVLVVGGGVIGCAIARELAEESEVHLLERDGVAAGATGRSAGLVAPSLFYGDVPQAARKAVTFFEQFGELGEFVPRHRYDFVRAADEDAARSRAEQRRAAGFDVRYVDQSTVLDEEPRLLADGYVGAVRYDDTGWVDPYSLAIGLADEARAAGATIETDVTVTSVRTRGNAVVGVDTDDGPREGDAVVLAAGWRTPGLLPAGVSLPITPYRTQCVVLDPDDPLDGRFPLGRLADAGLYFRPELNGDLLVGGSSHKVDDPTAASRDADESFVRTVATTVPNVVSGLDHAGVVNGWAGFDAATPDSRPIVDVPPGAPDGLVVATGFNGLGVMISPIAAPLVSALLCDSETTVPHDPFRADRFDRTDGSFELKKTSDV
ncbi:MAG: NAD(P)/FAD-dependent oxidoreductase [Halobacteriota archaeon]